jgi:hypothetical protein
MSIKKEEIVGSQIINEFESTNIKKTIYNIDTKKMLVEFKNGLKYEYENVPHQEYTKFRLSPSQGKFFNSEMAKKYKYSKI